MRRYYFVTVCLVAVGGMLCSTDADDANVSDKEPAVKIDLKEGSWKDVEKYVAENPGRVVVVDIWSTSCLPCVQEFPNLVKLQRTHGKQIACVSFNIDYVGIKSKPVSYYRPRVEKFLTEQKAGIRNYLCSVESDVIFDELKLNSIPAAYVFGKDGKLAKRFDDSSREPDSEREEAFTYKDDVNPFVEGLLTK